MSYTFTNKITALVSTLVFALFISGCNDLFETQYDIKVPSGPNGELENLAGRVFVGENGAPPALNASLTDQLPSTIIVNYDRPPNKDLDIILNGRQIGQFFAYEPTRAVGDLNGFRQFLRQGRNTLSVDQLGFGPTAQFDFDNQGPVIVITRGEIDASGNTVEIEGFLRDPSQVASSLELDLVEINGYSGSGQLIRQTNSTVNLTVDPFGRFCAGSAKTQKNIEANVVCDSAVSIAGIIDPNTDLLYDFTAKDIYDYTSEKEYLADSNGVDTLPIKNAVRVAVGDSFIESLRPVIANALYNSLSAAPIDARCYNQGSTTEYDTTGNGCNPWNDIRICGTRGVVPNKNISPTDWADKVIDARLIDNPDLTDDEKIALGDAVVANPAGGGFVDVDGRGIDDSVYTCTAADAADFQTDGGTLGALDNPVTVPILFLTLQAYVQRFYFHDGSNLSVGGQDITGRVGTALLNGFKVKGNNTIDIDLVLTELLVKIGIPGFLEIDLGLYIQRIIVDTDAIIEAVDNEVKIELVNSNFDLQGVRLDDAEVCIGFICIPLDGLGNLLIPILEGLIGDLLPGIINPILEENLNNIVIGGSVFQPENNTSFNLNLNVQSLGTESVTGESFDLVVGLQSIADVTNSDVAVNSSLGPVFVDDPIDPGLIFNAFGGPETNLSLAVSSNLINQSLNAVYNVGATHFTLYDGNLLYGAQPMTPVDKTSPVDANGIYSLSSATKGDTRTRLWPDMPPALSFVEVPGTGGAAIASIEYESATISQDELVDLDGSGPGTALGWRTQLEFNVNFNLGVLINQDNGVFTLGSAGPPTFNINSSKNNTNIQIPQSFIQGVLDTALFFGGDLLADRFVALDLAAVAAGAINGTEVRFLSDRDDYRQDPGECVSYDTEEGFIPPDINEQPRESDGQYDLVCQRLNFILNTSTVGVTGDAGRNLFFQIGARDPAIPPAPAIPRLDLDEDGILDFQDNCSLDQEIKTAAIIAAGGLANNVDSQGNVSSDFENAIKANANRILSAQAAGISVNFNRTDANGNLDIVTEINSLPATSIISNVDQDWYNSTRFDDAPLTVAGGREWLKMRYSNINNADRDADNIGDQCENDNDRDGIWAVGRKPGTGVDFDNCPATFNPAQEDNYGVVGEGSGDACNIRQTFVLLKSYRRVADSKSACLSHFNSTVSGNGRTNFTTLGWAECDQADAGQRFYFKENTNVAAAENTVIAQLWQSEARNNRTITTVINNDGAGDNYIDFADDVAFTANDLHKNNFYNDWIFKLAPSDPGGYPYQIQSYKFVQNGTGGNWCIFEKNIERPDQDNNSCQTNDFGYGEFSSNFQILVGSELEPWNGSFE